MTGENVMEDTDFMINNFGICGFRGYHTDNLEVQDQTVGWKYQLKNFRIIYYYYYYLAGRTRRSPYKHCIFCKYKEYIKCKVTLDRYINT